jgi:hypothetical protein
MNKMWTITIIIIVIIILFVCFGIKTSNKESFSLFSSSTTKDVNRKISSMSLNDTSTDDDPTDPDPTKDDPTGTGITGTYSIRDYYIFSSYNSCNSNITTTNNKVDTKSLKNVIAQGVRFLDFEIYSLNNEPIVATSSIPNNYFIKESNDYLLFRNVFDTIINTAFNISTAPNPTDPIFIHLRIKSTHQKMFSNMALIFKNYENSGYILGPQYSFEYQDCKDSKMNELKCSIRNITSLPLNKFKRKIILIIDKQNTNVLDNKDLMEYCNLMSYSINCRLITNYEMKNSPDQNELIEFNKISVSIVTPDIGAKSDNPNISTANLLGIQFTAINFSNENSLYTKTLNLFNNNGTAFILKPEKLRYKPMYIPIPNDPPPGYSFAPRKLESRYYSFTI